MNEFWGLTWPQFWLIIEGKQEKEEHEWDIARHIMWSGLAGNPFSKGRPPKPSDIIRLRRDEKIAAQKEDIKLATFNHFRRMAKEGRIKMPKKWTK